MKVYYMKIHHHSRKGIAVYCLGMLLSSIGDPVLSRLNCILAPCVVLFVFLWCFLVVAVNGMSLDSQFLALSVARTDDGISHLPIVTLVLTLHHCAAIGLSTGVGIGSRPRLRHVFTFCLLRWLVIVQNFLVEVADNVSGIISLIGAALLLLMSDHSSP